MTYGQWGRAGPPHCSFHFNSQPLMTYGQWGRVGPLHYSCHFKCELLMANGGRVGWVLTLLISLQISNADDLWVVG